MFGELIPKGGGDPIPLLKKNLLVGRRESCDVCLRFPNVSAHHCQLTVNGGYWFIKDLKSRNGVKVNGTRVIEQRIDPGDLLSIAKHQYELKYSPLDLGAVGPPPAESQEDVLNKPLLERAGLTKQVQHVSDPTVIKRFDPLNNQAGQIKIPGTDGPEVSDQPTQLDPPQADS